MSLLLSILLGLIFALVVGFVALGLVRYSRDYCDETLPDKPVPPADEPLLPLVDVDAPKPDLDNASVADRPNPPTRPNRPRKPRRSYHGNPHPRRPYRYPRSRDSHGRFTSNQQDN